MKQMLFGIVGHYDTPNFGDLLLATLVKDAIQESGNESVFVFGYGPNRENAIRRKLSGILYALKLDAIIFGGGGYLEGSGRYSLVKHLPFFIVSKLAVLRGKKIAIFGAGGGRELNWLARRIVSWLISTASLVYLRDQQSIAMAERIGCSKNVKRCVDLAQCIAKRGRYQNIFSARTIGDQKRLLVHADTLFHGSVIEGSGKEFCEAIKSFVPPQGWIIEIFFDYLTDPELIKSVSAYTGAVVHFGLPIEEALEVIWNSDSIISTKFHVPLVSFALNKPVWGLSAHPKVKDLFSQYGREDHYYAGWQGLEIFRKLISEAMTYTNSTQDEDHRSSQEASAVKLYDEIGRFCALESSSA